jgi:hypothetical protein
VRGFLPCLSGNPTTRSSRLRAVVLRYTAWHARHHVVARGCQFELTGMTPAHYDEIVQLRHQTNGIFRIGTVRWYRLGGPGSPGQPGEFYAYLALRLVMGVP